MRDSIACTSIIRPAHPQHPYQIFVHILMLEKTKLYELLRGGKYKYTMKEEGETEKKPIQRIQPEKVEEEPPEKRSKKTKAAPTT